MLADVLCRYDTQPIGVQLYSLRLLETLVKTLNFITKSQQVSQIAPQFLTGLKPMYPRFPTNLGSSV